jgi:hypothetical protein
LPVAGALIIAAVIWEVFKDLFHPAHSGALSDWIGRHLLGLLRRWPARLPLAGPFTLVTVIGSWVLLLVLGFALVYYNFYPRLFSTSVGSTPPGTQRFLTVLYFSFETLITLGYGDVVPTAIALRFAATIEAMIGFGLLTASLSSILLLYPALARMRLLARGIGHCVTAERTTGLSIVATHSDVMLAGLARDVTNMRIDLVHFPITYYFAPDDRDASVARWMPRLVCIAREGMSDAAPPHVRLAAATLNEALDDLARYFAERFVDARSPDRDDVFAAVARDHAVELA